MKKGDNTTKISINTPNTNNVENKKQQPIVIVKVENAENDNKKEGLEVENDKNEENITKNKENHEKGENLNRNTLNLAMKPEEEEVELTTSFRGKKPDKNPEKKNKGLDIE